MRDFEPLDAGPYLDHVGPLLRRPDGTIGLRIEGRHLNSAGKAHGGLLASIADHAIGRAVNEALEDAGAVTVSLTTDYLGAVSEGDLVEARTHVDRLGGSLAFADCTIAVDGKDVVRARAVFAVLG
jgi:uncharacterized protein (TIGR00369 family)